MVFGMSLQSFTAIHVAISLIGILSGLIVLAGMFSAKPMNGLTALFLATTALTSISGYGFPFVKVTPADILGALSLIVLAIAAYARYSKHLVGGWRRTYVITAVIALYFNVFVLVVSRSKKCLRCMRWRPRRQRLHSRSHSYLCWQPLWSQA